MRAESRDRRSVITLSSRLHACRQAADDRAHGRASGQALLGLMSDAPELVDDVCAHAYAERARARMRDLADG